MAEKVRLWDPGGRVCISDSMLSNSGIKKPPEVGG